jgi:hypothetical protein
MKLYDKEKEFEVAIKGRITPALKNEFTKAMQAFKLDVIQEEKLEALKNINLSEAHKLMENNDSDVSLAPYMQLAIINKKVPNLETVVNNDNVFIELLKVIIETKLLKPDELKLISTKATAEFWQNQDITEVYSEVNNFRQRAGI